MEKEQIVLMMALVDQTIGLDFLIGPDLTPVKNLDEVLPAILKDELEITTMAQVVDMLHDTLQKKLNYEEVSLAWRRHNDARAAESNEEDEEYEDCAAKCEHGDICDWWNVCTGDCKVCEATPFDIVRWCHHSCYQKKKLEGRRIDE